MNSFIFTIQSKLSPSIPVTKKNSQKQTKISLKTHQKQPRRKSSITVKNQVTSDTLQTRLVITK